jgi:hypothetical protein
MTEDAVSLIGKRVEFDVAAFPKTAKYAGQVWLVQRKLQVNIEMLRVDASGNTFGPLMRTHPSMVRELTGDAPAPVVPTTAFIHLEFGSIVRVNGISKIDPSTLFVVIQDKGFTAKLVKLGGDGGRYWPNIPRTALTLVDVKDIIK